MKSRNRRTRTLVSETFSTADLFACMAEVVSICHGTKIIAPIPMKATEESIKQFTSSIESVVQKSSTQVEQYPAPLTEHQPVVPDEKTITIKKPKLPHHFMTTMNNPSSSPKENLIQLSPNFEKITHIKL